MRAVTMQSAVLTLATMALAAGCYGPKLRNFGFSCDPQAIKPCPDGYFCNSGFCDDGSGGTPPGGTGGNGDADMATGQGGGGGGGGGKQDMAMAGQDMSMAGQDMSMAAQDMAKPADMVVVSSCAHDECSSGGKLTKTCSACVTKVCNNDPYCCSTTWDSFCIGDVNTYCTTKTCP